MFFIKDSKGFILEDGSEVLITEDDVRAYVVVGVLVDVFEYGGVYEGDDFLGFDPGQFLVALYFILLIKSQSVQSPQIWSN